MGFGVQFRYFLILKPASSQFRMLHFWLEKATQEIPHSDNICTNDATVSRYIPLLGTIILFAQLSKRLETFHTLLFATKRDLWILFLPCLVFKLQPVSTPHVGVVKENILAEEMFFWKQIKHTYLSFICTF